MTVQRPHHRIDGEDHDPGVAPFGGVPQEVDRALGLAEGKVDGRHLVRRGPGRLGADQERSRLVHPARQGQAPREDGLHESGTLGEIPCREVLPHRLVVAAQVLEGASDGPMTEELVRIELEGSPRVGELGLVVAAEGVMEAHEGRDHHRERIHLLRPAQRARSLVAMAAQVEDEAEPLVGRGGGGGQVDGTAQLPFRAVPVPVLQEAEESRGDVGLGQTVVEGEGPT